MQKSRHHFLLLITFVSGFSIMAMEISASRLLAPYFGTSLFVWTNIIGIVLIALSIGYYVGGKLADKKPKLDILLKLIFSAGILFLIIPYIIKPLVSFADLNLIDAQPATFVIFISSLLIITILFAIPLFLLGIVSPFIIKLYSISQHEKIGELSGKIFAISTVGSILGTFLPTLFFIPVIGTKATINIFAILLILLGSFGFSKNKFNLAVLAFLPFTLFYSNQTINNNLNIILEDESAYQYIRVAQNNEDTKFLIFNEGTGVQSIYNKDKVLYDMYYDYFNVLPYLINKDEPKQTLIIGLAGGTAANQLKYFFGNDIQIEGVEIDQKVIDISKEYFGLTDDVVKIHNQDGRMFLRNNNQQYDFIIVDAYSQQMYIPWTLTTVEFWQLVKSRLLENGIMAININSNSSDSDLLKSITNTIASVFENVYVTKTKNNDWNYIVAASDKAFNFLKLNNLNIDSKLLDVKNTFIKETQVVNYDENYLTLTDDKAPIEFMTDMMTMGYLKGLIKEE